MSTWYKRDVGDGTEAFQPSMKLHEAFATQVATGSIPKGISVFSIYALGTNLVTWYFSPEASSLATLFEAEPCDKPVPEEGFGLLVGDASSWEVHFPNYIKQRHGR